MRPLPCLDPSRRPSSVRAVVTSRAAGYPASFSRSGMRLSRRNMIAAAGDDASLLALSLARSTYPHFCALFAHFSPLPVTLLPFFLRSFLRSFFIVDDDVDAIIMPM